MNHHKIKNSLGMFDFLKGLSMISVVVYHSSYLFNVSLPAVKLIDSFIAIGLFNALFVVNGYGFEKRSVKKHFVLQCRTMLRPFLYTAIISAVIYGILQFCFLRKFSSAVIETLRLFVSILLGIPNGHALPVFGFNVFIAGPMWYILAAFWSVIFLNIFLNYIKEKYIPIVLLIAFTVGCALRESPYNFFSIGSALFACPLTYIGYKIKKTKLLQNDSEIGKIILSTGVLAAAFSLFMFLKPIPDLQPEFSWVSIVKGLHCATSAIFLFFVFTIAGTFKGKVVDAVCTIGRYALDVYIVHSIEFFFPWNVFADIFATRPLLGVLVITVCRSVIIAIVCLAIYWFKKIKQERSIDVYNDKK